jgi:CMP/dCMP kinase
MKSDLHNHFTSPSARAAASSVAVIAIDGPTASGKGAVAQVVAERLGFFYLDSGALYRLVALLAVRAGWARAEVWSDAQVHQLALWGSGLDVGFEGERIVLSGEDVAAAIRSEDVGNMASSIATVGALRAALLQRQRDFAIPPGLVADGRDMASVVFPRACLKIFLTADADIRGQRRYKQLIDKGNSDNIDDLDKIIADLHVRDERDRTRALAPLKPVADALVIDTSDLTLDQSIEAVLNAYQLVRQQA